MFLNLLLFYLWRKHGVYLTVIAITGSQKRKKKNLKAGIISIDISHYKESWKSKRCRHLKKDRDFSNDTLHFFLGWWSICIAEVSSLSWQAGENKQNRSL